MVGEAGCYELREGDRDIQEYKRYITIYILKALGE